MKIPILSVRDNEGNIIPIPAIQGPKGDKGDTGEQGPKGDKGEAPDAVLYTPQTLTPEEQAQARKNIGAIQIPCITGAGAPTTATEGAVGCLYMDTSNGDIYKCTAVSGTTYTWAALGGGNTQKFWALSADVEQTADGIVCTIDRNPENSFYPTFERVYAELFENGNRNQSIQVLATLAGEPWITAFCQLSSITLDQTITFTALLGSLGMVVHMRKSDPANASYEEMSMHVLENM